MGATVQAGLTYTLTVDVGFRNDGYHQQTDEIIQVNGQSYYATGAAPTTGDWSTYTAVYTAKAADVGDPITIILAAGAAQGDWDNVQLSAVPEPAAWALMLAGLGLAGAALRRRKTLAAA